MKSLTFNIDCMKFMRKAPDKYFDLAIVDPPYGINFGTFNRTNTDGAGNRYKADKYKNGDWDTGIPDANYFAELKRVSKHQIIWGGNYFLEHLGNSRGMICWYKKNPVKNFSDCEFAHNSIDCPAKVFEFTYYGNLEGNTSAAKKIHPTQKPVSLYVWLLQNYAKPGDKILDTHLGSGSSRIAAHREGFDFWGCEIDKDYFMEQEKRFANAIKQNALF